MNKADFLKAEIKDLREKLDLLKRQQAGMDDAAAKARAEGEIRSVQLSLEKTEAEQTESGHKK